MGKISKEADDKIGQILIMVTAVFIILKLTKQIDWSWWWVWAPLYTPILVGLVLYTTLLIVRVIKRIKNRKKYR